jgi:hypothetical protein
VATPVHPSPRNAARAGEGALHRRTKRYWLESSQYIYILVPYIVYQYIMNRPRLFHFTALERRANTQPGVALHAGARSFMSRRSARRAPSAEAALADDFLDLPPLTGGHEAPAAPPPAPPPPRPPVLDLFSEVPAAAPATCEPRRGPSRKRMRNTSALRPPPASTGWDGSRDWVLGTFAQQHALLAPALSAYLAGGREAAQGARARCRSAESFFHAFYAKEAGHASRALGTAVHFLLMERWRAALTSRYPTALPAADRSTARRLADPLLQRAASAVAERTSYHRESAEFADAVVECVRSLLWQERGQGQADGSLNASSDSSGARAAEQDGPCRRRCVPGGGESSVSEVNGCEASASGDTLSSAAVLAR